MSNKEVEAQLLALLDIVNNNYAQAIKLVCDDIEIKEASQQASSSKNYCG